ncbi:MAG: hypothetical protein SYR96_27965 [Actinomycetota bacterium]|nr:hypothetical protein [Actinomycetota bacterium]
MRVPCIVVRLDPDEVPVMYDQEQSGGIRYDQPAGQSHPGRLNVIDGNREWCVVPIHHDPLGLTGQVHAAERATTSTAAGMGPGQQVGEKFAQLIADGAVGCQAGHQVEVPDR